MYSALHSEFGGVATPDWNFWMHLIGADGALHSFFPGPVEPTDGGVTAELDKLLS